ncbi:CYFA0S01e12112g1_1 [Cyberlindnera fabianii]|uniref:CYFA0S01e12112g1_1 n=1 Tax=Cyberlindnera fabianii TaxID=36022 RepID=A0A061AQD9_CYBFA|nr:CYFA0S01e12112g1_1 [Cyberlindnera fabianii]
MSFYHDHIVPNIGLVFLVLAQFFNSIMAITTKLLETDPSFGDDPIHPFQILFVRMGITSIGCYLYMKYYQKETDFWGPPNMRLWCIARGFVGFTGIFSMYYSLKYLSVSDSTVISFLVPSMTGFLAWILLSEAWTSVEASGALISLLGVVMIARPAFLFGVPDSSPANDGAETSDPKKRLIATVIALVGVLGTSGVYIVIRFIGKRVHSLILVQYYSIVACTISFLGLILIPGLGFKIPQTFKQWFFFLSIGVSGFCMQFMMTEGIQREKASRASMMLYTQMIYALIWEVTIWHHIPGVWSWLGMLTILGSAFWVIKNKPVEETTLQPVVDEERDTRVQDELDNSNELDLLDDVEAIDMITLNTQGGNPMTQGHH